MKNLLVLLLALLFVGGCGKKTSEKIIGVWKLVIDSGKEKDLEYIEITPNMLITDKDKISIGLVDKDAKVVTSDVGGINFVFTLDEKDVLTLNSQKLFGNTAQRYIRSDKAHADNYYNPPMAALLGYWLNDDGFLMEFGDDYLITHDKPTERQPVKYERIRRGYSVRFDKNKYDVRIAENNTIELITELQSSKIKISPNFKRIATEEANKIRTEQKLATEKLLAEKKLAEEKALAEKKLAEERVARELAEKLAPLDKIKGVWVRIKNEKTYDFERERTFNEESYEYGWDRKFLEITDTELKRGTSLQTPSMAVKIAGKKMDKNLPSLTNEKGSPILTLVKISADGNFLTTTGEEYKRITLAECTIINRPTIANALGYWVLNDVEVADGCKVVIFSGDTISRDGWVEKISTMDSSTTRFLYLARRSKEGKKEICNVVFYDAKNIGIRWSNRGKFTKYRSITKEEAEKIIPETVNYISKLSGYWRSKNKLIYNKLERYAYLVFMLNTPRDNFFVDHLAILNLLGDGLSVSEGFIAYYDKRNDSGGTMTPEINRRNIIYCDKEYERILHFTALDRGGDKRIIIIDKDTIRVNEMLHSTVFIRIPESEAAELIEKRKK